MTSTENTIQQKLRKIHPNLESQIKSELKKILKENISSLLGIQTRSQN